MPQVSCVVLAVYPFNMTNTFANLLYSIALYLRSRMPPMLLAATAFFTATNLDNDPKRPIRNLAYLFCISVVRALQLMHVQELSSRFVSAKTVVSLKRKLEFSRYT